MSLATRIGEEFNLVRDEGMARLNALAPYNGVIGTDTKQQQENLVFSTTVGNEYKLADTSRFRKIDGKVLDTYGPELITNGDFSDGTTGWSIDAGWSIENNRAKATGAGGSISQWLPAVVGTKLVITVYVDNLTSATNNCDVKYNNVTILAIGSSTPIGKYTVYVNAVANGQFRVFSYTGVPGVTLDNISVREVQTIDFSRNGQHPFEVYTNTALTAPNNVLAGDYVVVDNPELVTNGTFDSSLSGTWVPYSATTAVISNGVLELSGLLNGRVSQAISTIIGAEYTITAEVESPDTYAGVLVSSTQFGVEIQRRANRVTTGLEVFSWTFTAIATTMYIQPIMGLVASGTARFDNISVKLVDDTYRATRDSSKMYDYNDTSNVVVNTIGEVLYCTGNNPSGIVGNFYKKLSTSISEANTTSLTSTANWLNLGTSATMSLQNPYFETRNYISNQVLAMQKADGTIHTETLFEDAYAVETSNAVLVKNGWSKLENGLYSKGTVIGTPVGYWQTLNKGRYSPVFNSLGVFKDTASKNWYETTFPITSVYSAFQNIGTVIGRPDSKSDKYVYTDQFRDLRTNAEKANIPQLLNEVHNGAVNGSLGGYSDCVGTEQVTQTTTGTVATLEVGTKLKYSVGDVLQIWNGTTPYRRFVVSVSGTTVTLDSTIVKTAVAFIISGGKLPIISYKTSLSTDVIGSPSFYPTMMKDRLASGKPLVGLSPLLVGQDGEDYTDTITYKTTSYIRYSEKSVGNTLSQIRKDDGGVTFFGDTVLSVNTITNKPTSSYGMANRLFINSYTSSNPVANISTPKAVQQVGNYAVATNSHSIYKGNNLTQLIGKVAVGNGVKGLENKIVEDVSANSTLTRAEGVFNLIQYSLVLRTKDCTAGILNEIYYYTGTSSYNVLANSLTFNNTYYTPQGQYTDAPTHTALTLDNSISPAIKTLSTIATADDGELLYQVFGEEIVGTGDTGSFSQLTNGTKTDWNGTTVKTVCATIGTGVYE